MLIDSADHFFSVLDVILSQDALQVVGVHFDLHGVLGGLLLAQIFEKGNSSAVVPVIHQDHDLVFKPDRVTFPERHRGVEHVFVHLRFGFGRFFEVVFARSYSLAVHPFGEWQVRGLSLSDSTLLFLIQRDVRLDLTFDRVVVKYWVDALFLFNHVTLVTALLVVWVS